MWWAGEEFFERILFFTQMKISRGKLATLLGFLLLLLSFTIMFILKYKAWRHNNLSGSHLQVNVQQVRAAAMST